MQKATSPASPRASDAGAAAPSDEAQCRAVRPEVARGEPRSPGDVRTRLGSRSSSTRRGGAAPTEQRMETAAGAGLETEVRATAEPAVEAAAGRRERERGRRRGRLGRRRGADLEGAAATSQRRRRRQGRRQGCWQGRRSCAGGLAGRMACDCAAALCCGGRRHLAVAPRRLQQRSTPVRLRAAVRTHLRPGGARAALRRRCDRLLVRRLLGPARPRASRARPVAALAGGAQPARPRRRHCGCG